MNKKKWVLITGADTGIGKAAVIYLSARGFGVYAGCLGQERMKQYAAISDIVPVLLDVTNDVQVKEAFRRVSDNDTGLYAVINNAGIALAGSTMELETEIFEKQFAVNLFGVHRVTKQFFPLVRQSGGIIIMIGSGAGLAANPFFAPYTSSKFALEGYADALRRELQFLGVRVIMIEPGLVKTPIWDKGEEILKNQAGTLLRDELDAFGRLAIDTARNTGLDPEKFAARIYKALVKKKPSPRYFVSPTYLQDRIVQRMPAKWLDAVLAELIRKAVKSKN